MQPTSLVLGVLMLEIRPEPMGIVLVTKIGYCSVQVRSCYLCMHDACSTEVNSMTH